MNHPDPIAPARGILLGMGASIAFMLCLGLLIWGGALPSFHAESIARADAAPQRAGLP